LASCRTRGLPEFKIITTALASEGRENANFEDSYVEDKLAIMFSKAEEPFGPGAFHMGPRPLDDKPASSSGRGLHYTTDGSSVDLWVWHAATATATAQCDYDRIGGPAAPRADQWAGRTPYKGGYLSDAANVIENFRRPDPSDRADSVVPLRLPRDLAATQSAMGPIDLDADHGERDGARWWLAFEESLPYSAAADAKIPVGTILPGVIAPNPAVHSAPESLRCGARWAAGRWTLIAARPLATNPDRVSIANDTFMWVAVFDHTTARHTRHFRPIRLEVK
jgi:hypothetical protein